jgi:4-amino-4-deoxy-L-arabinose transferase-like glycosyltransferase
MVNVRLPFTASGPHWLGIDNLYTEQAGAALLLLGSTFLALATRRGQLRNAAAAGFCFGLLALTKGVEAYVALGLFAALCLLLLLPRVRFEHRWSWKAVLMLIAAYGVVVAPWLYRNYTLFGSLQVAERGGAVLYMRALKDGMTADEYLGTFYVWAPGLQSFIGRALGYTPADLQLGGRLQRLNREPDSDFAARDSAAEMAGDPDMAVSFYRKARAERVRLQIELAARGVDEPTVEADRELQKRALKIVLNDLGHHLAMVIPFLWRGALTTSVVLILCWLHALAARRTDLAIFLLPASGTVAFYALFTHFIARYSVPIVPVATVAGLVLTAAIWQWCARRYRSSSSARPREPVPKTSS